MLKDGKVMTYSRIWKGCSKGGMGSKETLGRYLRRLTRAEIVLHDKNGYRINPVFEHPRLNELAKSLGRPEKAWEYSYFTPPSFSERSLVAFVQNEFNAAFRVYRWMLTKLVQVNNRVAGRELVAVFMNCQINPILDRLAKEIWLARKTVPLDALKHKGILIEK